MSGWEVVIGLTGQLLSWPVAAVLIVLILRRSLQGLLQRLSEAEGFGVKANFEELQVAVDRVELNAEIVANDSDSPDTSEESSKRIQAEIETHGETNAMRLRLRSAMDEARLNPKASIKSIRRQLVQRVAMWDRRVQDNKNLYHDDVQTRLVRMDKGNWISSDLKTSISTAVDLGARLSAIMRSPTESQAISYLTLVARLERLLDEEMGPGWRHQQSTKKATS